MVVEASAVPKMHQNPAQKRAGARNIAQLPAALSGKWVSLGMSPVSHFRSVGSDAVCVRKERLHS